MVVGFFFFFYDRIRSVSVVARRVKVANASTQSFPLCSLVGSLSPITYTRSTQRHRRGYTFPLMRSFFRQREHSVLLSPNHFFSGRTLVRPNLDRNTKVLRGERKKCCTWQVEEQHWPAFVKGCARKIKVER